MTTGAATALVGRAVRTFRGISSSSGEPLKVSTLHILDVAKDGLAYIGFELGCTWDAHGIGLLTYKNELLAVGSAPQAFDEKPAIDQGARPIMPI